MPKPTDLELAIDLGDAARVAFLEHGCDSWLTIGRAIVAKLREIDAAAPAGAQGAVAWRHQMTLGGGMYCQTRWLGMDEPIPEGAHRVEYAYTAPPAASEDAVDVIRRCLLIAVGDDPSDWEDADGVPIGRFLVHAVHGEIDAAREELLAYHAQIDAARDGEGVGR